MPTSSKQNHLDKLLNTAECKLTPKEWAIKFVDEIRQHRTSQEFFKATARGAFRESVYLKPYFALSQQAQDRYPGSEPQEVSARDKFDRDLRMEFQSLGILVLNVNRAIDAKVEMFELIGLVKSTQLSYLELLMCQDNSLPTILAAAEWIKRYRFNNGDRKKKCKISESLATYGRVMGQQAPTSLIGLWACMNTVLLKKLYAYDMAVQAVQDKYFGGHPILIHALEDALKDAIEILVDAISMLTEAQKERFDFLAWALEPENRSQEPNGRPDPTPDPIDVAAIKKTAREEMVNEIVNGWVTAAREEGVARILQETGEDLDFIWENFVTKFGANS